MEPQFVNALAAGFGEKLVAELDEALNRVGKRRHISLSRPGRELNLVETLLPTPLLERLRAKAAKLGVKAVYVPRPSATKAIDDVAGANWFRRKGYSIRTVSDVYGCAANRLLDVYRGAAPKQLCKQIRTAEGHEAEYKAGLAWLKPRFASALEANEQLGPARIARCGAAVLAFRAANGRNPG